MMRQESLQQGGERTVVLTEVQQRIGSSFVRAGMQAIEEETASGEKRETQQVTLGTSRDFMKNLLTLRADAEIDFGKGVPQIIQPVLFSARSTTYPVLSA